MDTASALLAPSTGMRGSPQPMPSGGFGCAAVQQGRQPPDGGRRLGGCTLPVVFAGRRALGVGRSPGTMFAPGSSSVPAHLVMAGRTIVPGGGGDSLGTASGVGELVDAMDGA
ncbi:MAG: hypothetical protein JXP73_12120 [Deltaproteobacteria bacterium]|nr:hypothetical protein [Deltaproteobacteria bacterium]